MYSIANGMFTAAAMLTVMILPTIAAISRDVIAAVPRAQREAMLALGVLAGKQPGRLSCRSLAPVSPAALFLALLGHWAKRWR